MAVWRIVLVLYAALAVVWFVVWWVWRRAERVRSRREDAIDAELRAIIEDDRR